MSIASRTFRLTGKFIKFLFLLLIFAINAVLIWRLFSTSIPSSMKALSPNESLAAAYEECGGELYAFSQEQRSITSAEGNYGYFSIERATFIPSANQIQIVFRYNNSTLRHTEEDFSLDSPPSRDSEAYDVSLYVVTDNTPEDKSDNLYTDDYFAVSTHRIHPTYFEMERTGLYNYRLFVFDLGELSLESLIENESLISVFADVYYSGAIDYDEKPYGTLCLFDYITETRTVKLSSADRKAIEGYLAG